MTNVRQKKENVKMHLNDLRKDLKKMHLTVTEELLLPQPDQVKTIMYKMDQLLKVCLLYTSPSPRDGLLSRMPSSA